MKEEICKIIETEGESENAYRTMTRLFLAEGEGWTIRQVSWRDWTEDDFIQMLREDMEIEWHCQCDQRDIPRYGFSPLACLYFFPQPSVERWIAEVAQP